MKNVSNEFKKIERAGGPFYTYAKCTLADKTELIFDSEQDFYADGNSFSQSGGGGFPLGSAVSKQITINLDNHDDRYSLYDFFGAKIVLYTEADLPNGNKERILEGTFTVIDSVSPGDALEINAYDNMYKLDSDFTSKLSFPVSLQQLWNELCTYFSLQNRSPSFKNDNYVVQNKPETMTGREMAGYIAQIAAGNALIDANGGLIIRSYDFSPFDHDANISAGMLEEVINDSISGGTFKDGLAEILSGGEFGESLSYYVLYDYTNSPDIATDDVTITGIATTVEGEDSEEETTLIYGTDDYAIQIDNPLILGNEEQAITIIGQSLNGVTIRPFSGDFSPAPSLEFMDMVAIVDRKDNIYQSFVTDHTFSYLGGSSIANDTETPERNAASYGSNSSQVYKKVKKDLIKQKTQWEKAMEQLSQQVANASGLYTTEEEQPDGSTIFYMHNKPTLGESSIVWKMTAETLTVSTDGGKTWNAGITVNGEVIAKIMTTIGINFDWGVGGTLIIEDADGNQTAYIDAETGAIRFKVESLEISGKTVEEIAQEHAAESVSNFVDSVYTPEIAQLQAQIDGQIMTWFYDYIPTTTNYPASEWTTGTEKEQHLGDLFYVVDNEESGGQAYRWAKIGNVYTWDYVKDTAVTKALASAQNAQDTADAKRRVFISTPVPPYDTGDLWTQGPSGDVMRCIKSRQSGAYVSSDWERASKYTDDTVANEALEESKKAKLISVSLNNDYQGIPTDENGNYTTFPECKTISTVFFGSNDISSQASYSIEKSSSIVGNWDLSSRTYTVTGLTSDAGWVDITASYLSGALSDTKRFNVTKQKQGITGQQGDPGRSYHMELSAKVIKKDSNGEMYPSQIEIALKYIDGQSSEPKDYFGKIKIEETTDGTSYTQKYLSSSLEYGHTYTPSDTASSIRITMYSSSGTQVLDIETVAVLVDVDNLTQEQVFDILTDGGRIQGIFMQDGQLYFNGQYMKMHSIYTDSLNVGIGGNLYYCGYDTLEHITNDTLYYNLGGNTGVVAIASVNNYGPGSQYDYGIIPPYGTKSIRLVTSGSTDTWMYLGSSQNDYGCIPVTSGKTYRLSCYVRVLEELVTDNIPCQLYVVGHTSINNVNAGHPASTSFTAVKSEWTRPYVDYTADGTYPYISVRIDADAPSTTFWCCFQIEEITSDEQETSPFRPAGTLVVNGANMLIGSIGADKISINDLVALNATIGKWHIAENYLWSEYTTGRYSVIKSDGDVMIATNSTSRTDTTGATCQIWHDGHITVGDTAGGGIRTEIYGDTFDMYNQGGYAFQLNYNGGMELWGNADGNPTPYIDFHYDGSQQDYSVRLICNGPDSLSVEGGTLNTASDISLKKDVQNLDETFETFFNSIVPISFRYKGKFQKRQIGYNANNIEEAILGAGMNPDDFGLYHKDINGIRSLAYTEFVPLNTYMIQKCIKKICELEIKIECMNGKIKNLERREFGD